MMTEKEFSALSKKLNVLISLSILQLYGEKNVSLHGEKGRKGIGELTNFLNALGLDAEDISEITGSPITSIRTLLTPKRRK